MYNIIFSISLLLSVSSICLSNKNDDKLLLSPVELIDLVIEEQHKTLSPPVTEKDFPSDDNYEQEESCKDHSDNDQGNYDFKTNRFCSETDRV